MKIRPRSCASTERSALLAPEKPRHRECHEAEHDSPSDDEKNVAARRHAVFLSFENPPLREAIATRIAKPASIASMSIRAPHT